MCGSILSPNLPDLNFEETFPALPKQPCNWGGGSGPPLCLNFVGILTYQSEFFEGNDHGSFISIFWPLVAKKKKTL